MYYIQRHGYASQEVGLVTYGKIIPAPGNYV
jgi:hypothetical protein